MGAIKSWQVNLPPQMETIFVWIFKCNRFFCAFSVSLALVFVYENRLSKLRSKWAWFVYAIVSIWRWQSGREAEKHRERGLTAAFRNIIVVCEEKNRFVFFEHFNFVRGNIYMKCSFSLVWNSCESLFFSLVVCNCDSYGKYWECFSRCRLDIASCFNIQVYRLEWVQSGAEMKQT